MARVRRTTSVQRAIGPAVGGLLIAAAGVWVVFAINAASFVAGVVVLWRWRRPVEEDVGPPERFAGAVRAGVRYALFSRVLQGVVVRSLAFGLASAGLMSLLPVYSSRVLGLGSSGLGALFAGMGSAPSSRSPFCRRCASGSATTVCSRSGALVAAALVAFALVDAPLVAYAVSFVAGLGWLCCLSTFNVASQEALPGWVRARGLAFYLTAISAGIALGSAAWAGSRTRSAYACGAAAIVVTLALGLLWRFDDIAGLDLSPAPLAAPEGRLIGAEHVDSPALVVVRYDVRPECEEDFLRTLRLVGRVRRRTGATSWSCYRDPDQAHRFIETFVLPSWAEHMRQHRRRTATDADLQAALVEYLENEAAVRAWPYVEAPPSSPRLWRR